MTILYLKRMASYVRSTAERNAYSTHFPCIIKRGPRRTNRRREIHVSAGLPDRHFEDVSFFYILIFFRPFSTPLVVVGGALTISGYIPPPGSSLHTSLFPDITLQCT